MKGTARQYYEQGNNIVVLNGEKQPLVKWDHWQNQRQTIKEFESLPWDHAEAFAIVCGLKLSNGLYVGAVDVDNKRISKEAIKKGEEFQKRLRITQVELTPSKGKHYVYFSRQPIKSVNTPSIREFCGCELLGEKRLCIMAPSERYARLNDNSPTELESLEAYFNGVLKSIGYKTPGPLQQPSIEFHGKKRFKIRPCVKALLQKPHLTHDQRVIITSEYFHAGFTQEQIESLFRDKKDVDKFNEGKTRYQVQHITGKPYLRYSCSKLQGMVLCLSDCPIGRKEFLRKVESL